MLAGLLIAAVVLAALACPLMMWLGRRGIGPGCALSGCTPQRDEETLESLRARHEELSRRLEALEADRPAAASDLERV
jgi:hypothetical protein